MSKGYEETMLTLTLSGAVMRILVKTFNTGVYKHDVLNFKCIELYNLIRELTKQWPQQNNQKTIKNIIDKTNEKIRGNKHLQGSGIYIFSLISLITGRLTDLNYLVKDQSRSKRLNVILAKLTDLTNYLSERMEDEDAENEQFEIGDLILQDLDT